ncbi:hypothetical protein TNCV_883011 [Trichonephila clavipes]|nr:hypothetical protein TNCV_883011 [Trichonephila clavipes]
MIVCPKGRTTSRYSLVWDMPSPYCLTPYSAPDCPKFFEVCVPIPQSASVKVLECSPEDAIVPQDVSLKHSTHVLWDLNQGRTLTNPFK